MKRYDVDREELAEFIYLLERHPELWDQLRQIVKDAGAPAEQSV